MIKVNNGTPAFIATGAETMTSRKVGELVLNFQTSLQSEVVGDNTVNVGKVGSWLFDETMSNVMGVQKIQNLSDFTGKDILETLTEEYISELKALNPNIEFVNTLKA